MAEQSVSSVREQLRVKAKSQATEAPAGQGVPDTEKSQGMAARAAAILAGRPDPAGASSKAVARDDEPPREDWDEGEDEGEGTPHRPGAEDDEGQLEGEGEADEGEGEGEGEGKPEALATVDDAAKKLGLSRAEFNQLRVQVGTESLTIGKLKEKFPEILKLDRERESLDDERGAWELERVASYRNINAIIDQLPRNALTSQVLHQLQEQHEESRSRELQNLHFARPKWSDATYATAMRGKMAALAKEYGITGAEVASVLDHRQVLLLQDYAELREKVKASRDAARRIAEPSGARSTGQQGPAKVGQSVKGLAKDTQANMAVRAGQIIRRK